MSRNKYPEQTINKILNVAFELFTTKGYEKTTIQDIVNELGMSKGAIYHHFKSKEEILETLGSRSYEIRHHLKMEQLENCNGLERIKAFIKIELGDSEKIEIDKINAKLAQIPQAASEILQNNYEYAAPVLQKMIEDAVADGSATVADPQMCAELIATLLNIWVNPYLFPCSGDIFMRRVSMTGKVLESLGLPLIDEELLEIAQHYYQQIKTVL